MSAQQIDNGGAAFPVVHPDGRGVQFFGMSMRDAFALAALQGLLAESPMHCDCTTSVLTSDMPADTPLAKLHATAAYMLADAMLKARAQ